ncbi:MAG: glycosyltransferase [Bacteroides fragilis]|nr:glycosyltransferase [Bacteroides fragilis]
MNLINTEHNELISVIIPVYNTETYLPICLDSVVNQTYREIEIILVDDGSTDTSGRICGEYERKDSRITVIHQENQGVSAARNHGLDCANGNWIVFIDADDWVECNYLESCLPFLSEKIDIVFVNEWNLRQRNAGEVSRLEKRDIELFERVLLNKTLLSERPHLSSPCTKIYSKRLIDNCGLRFDQELKKSEDALFNQKFFYYAKNAVWIKQGYYHYVQHEDSMTHAYSSTNIENYKLYMDKLKDFFLNAGIYEKYSEDFQYRILYNFFYCLATGCCHPKNGMTFKERKQRFNVIMDTEEYYRDLKWDAIHLYGPEALLGWFVRHRMFLPVNILLGIYGRI